MQVLIGFSVFWAGQDSCTWCGRAAAGQTICLRPPARAAIDGAPSTRSGCGGKSATAAVAAAAEAAEAAAEGAESAVGCSSSLSSRSHSSWSSRSLRYRPCTTSRRTPAKMASVSQRGLQGTGLPRSTLHRRGSGARPRRRCRSRRHRRRCRRLSQARPQRFRLSSRTVRSALDRRAPRQPST